MQLLPIRILSLSLVALSFGLAGCGPLQLLGYWMRPDVPHLADGAVFPVHGLQEEVRVWRHANGVWKIHAANESDAMRVQGYLVARDRMFQLDLFRHMARGEIAALLGDRQLGEKSTLQTDLMNRALGFAATADEVLAATSAEERALLAAYVDGINAWIAEGHLSIEHRLLSTSPLRAWQAGDSISIYVMLMHSLSGNADREMRRLRVACEVGLDAMEQLFPTTVLFGGFALPPGDVSASESAIAPAVVPEIRAELTALCEQGRAAAGPSPTPLQQASAPASVLDLVGGLASLSTSNNWVIAGALTKSGKPILSSDPHLPHMNPPILWAIEMETPDHHVAGFTIPGLHRVVFGHNGRVAWGATTNHVDRQDLVVHKARRQERDGQVIEGYEVEGEVVPFEVRKLTFAVKDADPVEVSVRFTKDGPLLNDIEPFVAGRIPLTALRMASKGDGRDLDGSARVNHARSIADFIAGIEMFDQGCSNWVFADDQGGIGYRSPCRVPVRRDWRGTFPIPGWLRRYEWDGYVAKNRLPASTNPARGWIATANSDIIPAPRFFTAYNNDSSAPWRLSRIMARIQVEAVQRATRESSAAIQLDLFHPYWPMLRHVTSKAFCEAGEGLAADDELLRQRLCAWTGKSTPDSVEASLFNLWSNAVLDRALADALPQGASSDTWHFVQTFPQFEAVAQWLWTREEEDRIWDDERTAEQERRTDILTAAFADAAAEARKRWGKDVERWQWGEVRPFVLRHPFAAKDGFLGRLFNAPPLAVGGDSESVFKNQFARSDRQHMNPVIGPVGRFTIDLAEPWKATFTLAGGESGWPGSPHYGKLLADWAAGKESELTPTAIGPGGVACTFRPDAPTPP